MIELILIIHKIAIAFGVISFIYNVYDIGKYIFSFWIMRKAGIHYLVGRRNLSTSEMKIINEFLTYKQTTFFRLCNSSSSCNTINAPVPIYDNGSKESYYGPFRAATPEEQAALDTLVSKGFLKRNGGLSCGDHDMQEIIYYGDTFVTAYFRSVFKVWEF